MKIYIFNVFIIGFKIWELCILSEICEINWKFVLYGVIWIREGLLYGGVCEREVIDMLWFDYYWFL